MGQLSTSRKMGTKKHTPNNELSLDLAIAREQVQEEQQNVMRLKQYIATLEADTQKLVCEINLLKGQISESHRNALALIDQRDKALPLSDERSRHIRGLNEKLRRTADQRDRAMKALVGLATSIGRLTEHYESVELTAEPSNACD